MRRSRTASNTSTCIAADSRVTGSRSGQNASTLFLVYAPVRGHATTTAPCMADRWVSGESARAALGVLARVWAPTTTLRIFQDDVAKALTMIARAAAARGSPTREDAPLLRHIATVVRGTQTNEAEALDRLAGKLAPVAKVMRNVAKRAVSRHLVLLLERMPLAKCPGSRPFWPFRGPRSSPVHPAQNPLFSVRLALGLLPLA
jgi:hypothetical protein